MLYKVEVTNRRGNVLSLDLEESDDGIQIADIDGLDPVKAVLTSSKSVLDGEEFQHAKRGPRNIVFKFDLDPDFNPDTYTTLRQRIYRYFPTKQQITLRFFTTTGLFVDINGIVEDTSSPRFEKDPEVQVSVMCFQPDFIDPRIVTLEGFTVNDNTDTAINYPGSVEAGMVMTLTPARPVDSFTMYNMDESDTLLQMDFTLDLLAGDELVVSSLNGAKGITLTRAGVSSSVLYGRSSQSSWIQFFEGINQFRVYATGDPIPYELEYKVRYGGI